MFCRLRASYFSNLIRYMYKFAPRTTSEITVYRAFTRRSAGNLTNEISSTIYSPIPFSTTMDKDFAKSWGRNHSWGTGGFTLVEITVPVGTPVLVLNTPPPKVSGVLSPLFREREIILPPGIMNINWDESNNIVKNKYIINVLPTDFEAKIPTMIENENVATFTFNNNVVQNRKNKGAKQIWTYKQNGNIIGNNLPKYVSNKKYYVTSTLALLQTMGYGIAMGGNA